MDWRRFKGTHEGLFMSSSPWPLPKDFKQVYLPAIAGHVPGQMVHAIAAFLDFCYLVRCSVHMESTLVAIDDALAHFHHNQVVFEVPGLAPDGISLPRQHLMVHYWQVIELFGLLNGLCSSITESKHIKAVKEPWRRLSHYKALGQMLLTNQCFDKLATLRVDFAARGMLSVPTPMTNITPIPTSAHPAMAGLSSIALDHGLGDEDASAVAGPRTLAEVTLAKRSG